MFSASKKATPAMTECTPPSFTFADHGRRQVVARFDGGAITSDGGALLLRQTEQRSGIVRQFAACFRDHRQPGQVEHSVRELVSQRVYGLALGYEGSQRSRSAALGPAAGPAQRQARPPKASSGGGAKTAATPAPARALSTASRGPRPTPARKAVTRRSFSTRARWTVC